MGSKAEDRSIKGLFGNHVFFFFWEIRRWALRLGSGDSPTPRNLELLIT